MKKYLLTALSCCLALTACGSPYQVNAAPKDVPTKTVLKPRVPDKFEKQITAIREKQRADFEKRLLKAVKPWYGVRYEFGSQGKKGIDCAGFVQAVYDKLGYDITRASYLQYQEGRPLQKDEELKMGDLVFLNTQPQRGKPVSHVGIYLKDGIMVHAGTSTGVADITIENIVNTCPKGYKQYFARRLVDF